MWIDPKTNWTSKDVPLPGDFNRIEGDVKELEGNVRELKTGVDGLVIPKITNITSESRVINANAATLLQLPASAGHRFYLISVYSSTSTVVESFDNRATTEHGWVSWHLRRGKPGVNDSILILNASDSMTTVHIEAAYIS